jgi:hypothetical protein
MNILFSKKTLALLSAFLFLSLLATQSSIMDTVRASQDDNRDEITTQVCDIMKETTVTIRLTTQQIKEIQRTFDELKNRLSTTTSAEETQELFNATIIILNRYNLLPEGMSIEHAQHLVNCATTLQKRVPSIQILSQKLHTGTVAGTIQNSLCSIVGNTSNTHSAKLATRIAHRLFSIMDHSSGVLLVKVATALWTVLIPFSRLSEWGLQKDGYRCGVSIYFGNYHYYPYPNWFSPAHGWLSTNGINGKQDINGSFWGQTMIGGWQPQDDWYMNNTWRGCVGFTGLITHIGNSTYYLGSALFVNIGPNRP